jgi:hypothetical protein
MVNSQDEKAGAASTARWSGFDQLTLSDDSNSVDVTIGSADRWDKAHLRRLRQSADLPGLVPVIDADISSDGKAFAVTPSVEAPTLADRIPPSGREWEDCAAITEAAARATHEAHLRGLFHGSLSPDQIHVIDNDVAVNGIGLGLGGAPSDDYANWVAPEVQEGGDPTERSDVYSLGKILDASLGSNLEDVPRSVRRLIMWSSSDTPEARPPSALEFASILAEALGDDRKTYGPAFIPTAEANDLASTASESVAAYVPSERPAGGMAATAAAGAAAVGGAAAAASLIGDDDAPEVGDELADLADDVDLDADVDVDGVDVDGVDVDPTDIEIDATTTGELPAGGDVAAAATATGELSDTDLSVDEPVFDSREYSSDVDPDVDADFEVPAARTIDFDERFNAERKGNKAGILVGAILAAGLGVVAFQLLNSNDDATGAGDAAPITEDADADGEGDGQGVAGPSTSDGSAAEGEGDGTATGTDGSTAEGEGEGDDTTTGTTGSAAEGEGEGEGDDTATGTDGSTAEGEGDDTDGSAAEGEGDDSATGTDGSAAEGEGEGEGDGDAGTGTDGSTGQGEGGTDDSAAEGEGDDSATGTDGSAAEGEGEGEGDGDAGTGTDGSTGQGEGGTDDSDTGTDGSATEEESVAQPAATVDGPISAADAGVQVLHAIPGAEVDVYVNGEALAPGFTVGTIAGPAKLDPGTYDVALYAASDAAPASAAARDDDPILTETVTVGSEPATLAAHLDANGNPTISAFVEDFDTVAPASGRVELRHLAAAPPVKVIVDGEELTGLLEPGKTTSVVLSAGEHTIETTTADGTAVKGGTINLADGELANVSVIGAADADTIDIVVQRYTGLASPPAGVPTGNSNLLADGEDPTGLYILGALSSLMALAGGFLIFNRRNRNLL